VLEHWLPKVMPSEMPLYAFGASSGGNFVSLLPNASPSLQIRALCIQIAGVHPQAIKGEYPPTLIVHMPKDSHTERAVHQAINALRPRVIAAELQVLPQPLQPLTLAEHIPRLGASASRAVHDMLLTSGFLSNTGYLKGDPRHTSWQTAVQAVLGPDLDSLETDSSPIAEVLNVLWASHEIVAAPMSFAIQFLVQEGIDGHGCMTHERSWACSGP